MLQRSLLFQATTVDFELNLQQAGTAVSGTYKAFSTGTANGTVSGSTVDMSLKRSDGVGCAETATLTLEGGAMTGTFSNPACATDTMIPIAITAVRSGA